MKYYKNIKNIIKKKTNPITPNFLILEIRNNTSFENIVKSLVNEIHLTANLETITEYINSLPSQINSIGVIDTNAKGRT